MGSQTSEKEGGLVFPVQRLERLDPSGLGIDGEEIAAGRNVVGNPASASASGRGRGVGMKTPAGATARRIHGKGVRNFGVGAGVAIRGADADHPRAWGGGGGGGERRGGREGEIREEREEGGGRGEKT